MQDSKIIRLREYASKARTPLDGSRWWSKRPRLRSGGKTASTITLFVLLVLAGQLVPGLRLGRLPISVASHRSVQSTVAGSATSQARTNASADSSTASSADELLPPAPGQIEDPSRQAMIHFFDALAECETKGTQVRICHYGDSPITNDGITSTVRRKLQVRFGDAGHGFLLLARPWGWYGHSNVFFDPGAGWESDPLFISRGDGLYGLGCVRFGAQVKGVTTTVGTVSGEEVGQSVSSFDVYYLAQPDGGSFAVDVDGTQNHEVSTANETVGSGYYRVNVPAGPHRMTIRTNGDGKVCLFGVVLESDSAGVQYDSLGLNGAFVGLLANYINNTHWAEQLRHRKPDLVILNYGTNESEFENLPMDRYEKDTREVIRRIRAAVPDASILLIGPMDRGKRGPGGAIVTRPMIAKLVGYQRRLAAETGCAFFDAFTAMGGDGTVARWRETRPHLMGGDFTHPTPQGAEIVGTLIYDAITKAYDERRSTCCPKQ